VSAPTSRMERARLLRAVVRAEMGLVDSVPLRRRGAREAPLSFPQARLWMLNQLDPSNPAYNIPLAIRLSGCLDASAMQAALSEIVRRHEVLRTTIEVCDGAPIQRVFDASPTPLPIHDLTSLDDSEREAEAHRLIQTHATELFDLSRGPLFRSTLLRLAEEQHVLLITLHHIVSDGWSSGLLLRELGILYNAFRAHKPSPLPALPVQYCDYASWQREFLQGDVLERHLAYWKAHLAGAPSYLDLPFDRPRPAVQSSRGAIKTAQIPYDLLRDLKDLSQRADATLYMTLLAAFEALLHRHSGQEDFVVGTPIANRNRAETESLIGCMLNSLALRADLSGDPTFLDLLARARESSLSAFDHQDLPFEKLVEEIQPDRNLSSSPIFQVMFALQNAPKGRLQLDGLQLESVATDWVTSKFDLMLAASETKDGLRCTIEYNTDLFDGDRIERMLQHYVTLLEAAVADPSVRLSRLPLLPETERQQLLVDWNRTDNHYPSDRCIHELFEEQVVRTPDAIAVEFEGERLTYRELNARSNKLAHHLRGLGVGPETLVGICVERSLEIVVGLLGILKAGGAYVPLDPSYPAERLAYMAADSSPAVILVQDHVRHLLAGSSSIPMVLLDGSSCFANQSALNPSSCVLPSNLAYVIYTSGSTGQPKGVQIPHCGVPGLIGAVHPRLDVSPEDAWTVFHSYAFDFSVWELWSPLLSGGRLVLVPLETTRESDRLLTLVQQADVSILNLTPSALAALIEEAQSSGRTGELESRLRMIHCGGEALPQELARIVLALGVPLWNFYGPTESTVWATIGEVREAGLSTAFASVGRPFAGRRIYILDRSLSPVPVGVPGELYIGGAGLARGYLNRPELTAEKFVPDPFSLTDGERLYRTGDLARYQSDGNIEFLGRLDHQVKIRGFRIELGEIESVLLDHPSVREAVVVAREEESGEKRLVAYLAGTEGAIDLSMLREHLRSKLPDYMVPSAFMVLESLPLSSNGKIDRKALPAPDASSLTTFNSDEFAAPRTPIEEGLCEIWREVLRVEHIGIHDNFFELGGHSLLATQVISRIRKTFEVELPLRALFECPTIADLAERLTAAHVEGEAAPPPLVLVPREAPLPLSFAQQRLWFLDRLEPGNPFYNVSLDLRLTGPLNRSALAQSLTELVRRHESLRTVFAEVEGVPVQIVRPADPIRLDPLDLQMLADGAREAEARRLIQVEAERPFDLSRGPLCRTSLLRLGEEEHLLLLTIHHIISDGWSLGILRRELGTLYNAFCENRPSPLAELAIQYGDYAAWQRGWLQGPALENRLSYWMEHLKGAPMLLELPTDRPRPPVQTFRGAKRRARFSPQIKQELLKLGQREGVTLFMLLLAAFEVLLYRYSGQEDIIIGTPIANRTRTELEGLIGFFANTLALRADLSGDPSFAELLSQVKEAALGAYANQDLPFDTLVDEMQPARSLSYSPILQVVFMLQNAPRETLELDGLRMQSFGGEGVSTKFDLSLMLVADGNGLSAELEYSTDQFDAARMERLLGHFETLLGAIVANPNQRISRLPVVTTAEQQYLLLASNATENDYPREQCIHKLFEEQAQRSPSAIAVACENEQLTYAQLNTRANQLAHYLRSIGVGPETLVGVFIDRSVDMIVGLLGILKAGGAYLPLDPSYPPDRVAFMLSDSRASLLLTQAALRDRLETCEVPLLCLDADQELIAAQHTANPGLNVPSEALAYVIYTSGSTGVPKGVQVCHRSLLNLVTWHVRTYHLDSSDRCTQVARLAFDASVWEIWPPLAVGAALYIADEETLLSASDLLAWIRRHEVSVGFLPTPLAEALLAESDCVTLVKLRALLTGGDRLHPVAHTHLPFALINHYGPTESTVVATAGRVMLEDAAESAPPIGRPIDNTRVYLLDGNKQLVPQGVPGELYIGGESLARGYLNRPALTAERFVPDPFSEEPGARLYQTGDLCRYLPDGNLEYLGRVDHQVKVRGFRIELGEIESVLSQHPAVREAAVVAREDGPGDKRLAGYVVADRAALAAMEEFRDAEAQQVADWQALYEANYAEPNPEEDPLFNIKGWHSSYTGQPIPAEEMHEWVDSTVTRILALKPQRVVEIGCGTGLLLFQLLPHCQNYVAADFSAQAIRYVDQVLSQADLPADRLILKQAAADSLDMDGADGQAPDTVILNSVVQYFPSSEYLSTVLERAVDAVADGGQIFIGDVRNLTLLEEFQALATLGMAVPGTERERLRQRMMQGVAEEDELLLDPAFFYSLASRLPRVTAVEVSLKRGDHWNEMSQFRYDVLLRIGDQPAAAREVVWNDWARERMSIARLRELMAEKPAHLAISGIPNLRTAGAAWVRDQILFADGPSTADEIRDAQHRQPAAGVNPEEIWQLGAEWGYEVRVCPSGSRQRGCFDMVMDRAGQSRIDNLVLPGQQQAKGAALANDPVRGKLIATLIPMLRRHLEQRLPDYMVPSAFLCLDELPLSPNGKVDRKALPAPDGIRPDLESAFTPAQTATEETLSRIWAEVLRLEQVGIHDNFFELGGDSLLSIQIIARARQAGLPLTPRQVFQHQTIAELAAVAGTEAVHANEQGAIVGPVPLTPIQRWFFELKRTDAHHFNQSRLLTLHTGVRPESVVQAMDALVAHHDGLRLRYEMSQTGWNQTCIAAEQNQIMSFVDLSALTPEERPAALTKVASELQSSLNLESGPLLRACYFDFGPGERARLLLLIHHLVVDGVSWRVLLEDLQTVLEQIARSESVSLPAKTTSFQHWARRLAEHADSPQVRQEIDFWLSEAREHVHGLPLDDPGGANTTDSLRVVRRALSVEETRALLQEVPAAYHTQINDVLLAALAHSLRSWTGERKLLLDLEGHGREALFADADVSRTVGWFTSMYPVLLECPESSHRGELLKAVKEQLRAIPNHGIGYGLLRYLCSETDIRGRMAALPTAQVSFNYLGQFDQVVKESGLFDLAPEDAGPESSPRAERSHLLNVHCRISGDRLHVAWLFSERLHRRSTVERLADGYLEELKALIDHCRSPDAGGFTPSDFPKARVSQEALDRLLAGMRKK
jgi:amino acid adenylation domain-containing protein/non-ribosomal peptide synthase protein (TIGR01720 family)